MRTENLEYGDGGRICEAYVAYDPLLAPETFRRPCVLVSHAWSGQGDFERSIADKLARRGYLAFAVDLYGKGIRGLPEADNSALMQPFMENRALISQGMGAALAAARNHPRVDPERIAAIGYCFGGLCVLDLARSAVPGIKGVVSFHGMLQAPKLGKQSPIAAKVLILHGYDDPLATPDDLLAAAREFTAAKADWQIHAYGHTGHAFALPQATGANPGFGFDPSADHRSWAAMTTFLEETLL